MQLEDDLSPPYLSTQPLLLSKQVTVFCKGYSFQSASKSSYPVLIHLQSGSGGSNNFGRRCRGTVLPRT